jgi:hypothetical protein
MDCLSIARASVQLTGEHATRQAISPVNRPPPPLDAFSLPLLILAPAGMFAFAHAHTPLHIKSPSVAVYESEKVCGEVSCDPSLGTQRQPRVCPSDTAQQCNQSAQHAQISLPCGNSYHTHCFFYCNWSVFRNR